MSLARGFRPAPLLVLGAVLGCLILLRLDLMSADAGFVIVSGRSMEPALSSGDLVLAVERPSYRPGDVIAFMVPMGGPGARAHVIHRIVGGSASAGFVTQGDNTQAADLWRPKPDDVVGRMQLRVPRLGLAFDFVRRPVGLATVAALTALFLLLTEAPKKARARTVSQAPEAPPRSDLGPPRIKPPLPAESPASSGARYGLAVAAGVALVLVAAAQRRR